MAAMRQVGLLRALTAPAAAAGSSSLSSRLLVGVRHCAQGGHHLQGSSRLPQVSGGLWMGGVSRSCIVSSGHLSVAVAVAVTVRWHCAL